MGCNLKLKISINGIWFCLLMLYVAAGYFAHGVLLQDSVISLVLYAFILFSLFAIALARRIRLSAYVLWAVLCLFLSFFSMIYSPNFSVFSGAFYSLLVNTVLFFSFSQMTWDRMRFDRIMKTFAVAAAGMMLILVFSGYLEDFSENDRLGSDLFGNANSFGISLMLGAVCAIWLLVSSESKWTKLFSIVALIIIYYGIFLSGGRKYVVLPAVFAYVLLIHKTDKHGKKHFLRYSLSIILVAVILYGLVMEVPLFYERIGDRFEGLFGLLKDGQNLSKSDQVRKIMIEGAWKAWPERPLLGHGLDSFKYYNRMSLTGYGFYSHNNYVELLYNQGLLGFTAYYSIYIYLFYKALRIKKNSLARGFVLGGLAMLVLLDMVEVTYCLLPAQYLLYFACYQLNADPNAQKCLVHRNCDIGKQI